MPLIRSIVPLLLVAAVGACSRTMRSGPPAPASATIRNSSGATIGTLRLESSPTGVRITGQLTGLPAGAHGIHLHTTGQCEGPGFTSAGAHFNPGMTKHGLVNPDGPHAGDLPAIAADDAGRAVVDVITPRVSLDDNRTTGLFDLDGTSVVVHAANDDQRTDPTGNSGGRIACGVVQRS